MLFSSKTVTTNESLLTLPGSRVVQALGMTEGLMTLTLKPDVPHGSVGNLAANVKMKVIRVWQGVAMDSLKYNSGPHAIPSYDLRAGHPQGRQPAPVSYPFGHPVPYAYAKDR
jgi:hypothetical protein